LNDLLKKLASLAEAERWRLLSWLAREDPNLVERGLSRPSGAPLENAAIAWKISEPESEPVPDE